MQLQRCTSPLPMPSSRSHLHPSYQALWHVLCWLEFQSHMCALFVTLGLQSGDDDLSPLESSPNPPEESRLVVYAPGYGIFSCFYQI